MKQHSLFLRAVFVLACGFQQAVAQTPIPPTLIAVADAATARDLLVESWSLYHSSQYSEAELRAESAYMFFKATDGSTKEDLAEAAYLTGLAAFKLRKFGGAWPLFEESAKLWTEMFPRGSLETANALHYAGACTYYRGKLTDALSTCSKAYEIRRTLLPANHIDRSESLKVLGSIYLQLGEYSTSKDHYEQALAIAEISAGKESSSVADLLYNLSTANLRLGNFQKAIDFAEKALKIQLSILPPLHEDLGSTYRQLGIIYRKLNLAETSIDYLEKAIEVYRKNRRANLEFSYSEIGQAYLNKGDYSKAREYFELEHQLMVAQGDTTSSNYAYTCADFGSLSYKLKNYREAVRWYEKMVAIWRRSFDHTNSQLASMLSLLAQAQLANGEYETALSLNLEAKQIWQKLFGSDNHLVLRAEGRTAHVYKMWYLKTGQDSLLEKSREAFVQGKKGIDLQLKLEASQDGIQRLLTETAPNFESAIHAEWLYHGLHQDRESLEKAWQWSETMHGYQLYAATQEANARHFAGIPDAALRLDSLLGAQMAQLGKKRQQLIEKGQSLSDSSVLEISLQIASKMEEAQQLQAVFEKEYPDYFRLKNHFAIVTMAETQRMLSPEQTLVEYFSGDSSIFVFVVQRENVRLIQLKRDFPLLDWVKQLRDGMAGYYTSKAKNGELYLSSVQQYATYAQKLHSKLLAPLRGMLSPELVIIPGDGMADVPFEALLGGAPKDLSNFSTYPFVVREHVVSYAYSANMLHEMTTKAHREASQGMIAFAPFFEGDSSSMALRLSAGQQQGQRLLPLPFSGEEALNASKPFKGKAQLLLGPQATKEQFLRLAEHCRLIHLATHGDANQKAGEFSYLAFYLEDKPAEQCLLTAAELYNCPLNADLVVLSACETGIGEAQRGEGVISLARAFAYSGAKSIVASLWSVADKSTMLIMDNFYAGLGSAEPKNRALAKAKRRYIAQHPGLEAHPYFWAGFVQFGDMSALTN